MNWLLINDSFGHPFQFSLTNGECELGGNEYIELLVFNIPTVLPCWGGFVVLWLLSLGLLKLQLGKLKKAMRNCKPGRTFNAARIFYLNVFILCGVRNKCLMSQKLLG